MRLGVSLPALGAVAILALGAFTHAAPPDPADVWPAFRGPLADGTSPAKGIPTRWSETENVRWKTPVHGKGWSSPVVWGDQVWVTTADEVPKATKLPPPMKLGQPGNLEQATYFAVCLDRKSGKVVHDLKLRVEKDPSFCIDYNSYASPTPVIEDGRVYAHFGSHGTWCIDTATGKVVWERLDLKCTHFRGPGSSAVLFENLLILIYDGFDYQYVVALNKTNGETVWKTDREIKYRTDNGDYKKAYATARVLEVDGKPQVVCPSAECTIGYDVKTGKELWRLTHGGMNGAARPTAGHGLMFLTSGHTKELMAVKLGVTGAVPKDAIVWQTKKGVPTRPSLLLVGELLYMVSDDGLLTCLEAKTGKELWSDRMANEFSASPVYADGHIYAANERGKTYVYEAGPKPNQVAVNTLEAGCMASPAIAGDSLFLRTRTNLYCIAGK